MPLRACCYYGISSLLLCLIVFDLFLFTDLLVRGGRLEIADSEEPALAALLGDEVLTGEQVERSTGQIVYLNRGLASTLWHHRGDRLWRPIVAALYRRFTPLRNDAQALMTLVAVAALLGFLRNMLDSRARRMLLREVQVVAGKLRQSIHRQALRLGPSDLEGRASAQAFDLFTTEVDRLRDGVLLWAARMGRDPFQLTLLIALGLAVDPSLGIVCLVPAALCWYLAQREQRRIEEETKVAEDRMAGELRVLAEGLEKTRLVRGYGMETFEQKRFQKSLDRVQAGSEAAQAARAWSRRSVRALVAICTAFVLLFVGWAVLRPAHVLAYSSGLLMLVAFVAAAIPLRNLMRLQTDLRPAQDSAQRIQSYLNQIPEVGQAVGAKFLQPLSRLLVFENVSYTTPGRRQLLDGFNLKIPAGRTVALVASDPQEALAVACLVPRFIEPHQGRILIDGEDTSWVTLESLRAEAIFVGGKDPFLTASVRENISGGNESYSLSDVTEAAKIAHAHNFISKLPQGYETVIGEHGEQLDAGQGFRLGLARAALRKPAMLIIEEPSEPLDEDTKTMLDDAYKRLCANRTVLFLAQRLSTVKRADEIVLVHRGRLAAIGPHGRLVQSSALYRHWEYMKFNEFRAEFESA